MHLEQRQCTGEAAQRLEVAAEDFAARRWIIERLNVQATPAIEDGQKAVYVECAPSDDGEILPVTTRSL